MEASCSIDVVVDTGVFLRRNLFENLGGDIKVRYFTVQAVVEEIRDRTTRKHLPFNKLFSEVEVVSVSEKAREFVRQFCEQSGDYGYLSVTDLLILGAAVDRAIDSGYSLNSAPLKLNVSTKVMTKERNVTPGLPREIDEDGFEVHRTKKSVNKPTTEKSPLNSNASPSEKELNRQVQNLFGSFGGGSDGEGAWFDASNIDTISSDAQILSQSTFPKERGTYIMTSDFTIQNVAIQLGLKVLSSDGYFIKSVKRYIKICIACKTSDRNSAAMFCSKCGNSTLKRIPMVIRSSDSSYQPEAIVEYHEPKRNVNLRGTIYSIPRGDTSRKNKSGGGKKDDLILRADQLIMGDRRRNLKHQEKQYMNESEKLNPFLTESSIQIQEIWGSRKLLESGRFAGSSSKPQVVVGFGRGSNPNSNRWQKRYNNNSTR